MTRNGRRRYAAYASMAARALTTVFIMVLVVSAGTTAAVAALEAPPPVQFNRPCTLHDEYFIPLSGSMYYVNDVYQAPGYHKFIGTTVTIRPSAGFSGGPWTFDYPNMGEPCPAEAGNSMTVSMGACKPGSGRTDVTASYKNEADASTFPQENVTMTTRVVVYDPDDYAMNSKFGRLNDGESVSLGLIASGDGTLMGTGLFPGTYELQGWHMGSTNKVTLRFFVPPCGASLPPAGDPSGLGPSTDVLMPGGSGIGSAQATGTLQLLRRVDKVKVTAINRKVDFATTFKLKRPGSKKAIGFRVPAGKVVAKKVGATRGRYVLKARVKVQGTWRMQTVAKLTVGS